MDDWIHIGDCSVDSGQLILIDPCYIVGDEGDSPLVTYEDILQGWGHINRDASHYPFHLGMIIAPGWGDGYYPVYAKFEGQSIVELKIVFN